ncbi:nucleoside diphosphate kinase 6-like [Varroa jacobsoni]|uniref:Nucleoside diphosphate kinase-like domain-containing protein n=1 Tax=Varroa destructor TaxID=109461 RepID=A0A7M7K903_VARDE|nr:nucleoside diphosphate kinase 6-like [Varroa destructor]XP_022662296.1 nucleoside diphosphate kinase 6-like [Varroa destructor]XP_022662297.1 nucleoside diphosphate kinase 6-like [Varroa destructor]XP_022710088.1 nucleoside diphosphate kinase 6-like [Varroa jacobsoni]XP_022710089.1 nucleoside diphosphate kinase 6-like [Varroa jacobsoni]XP_022710090.1 nucleoside diphosphate kinase 6-like [Varroa jacobsoni]XP_022710091.1 nucleoside diphosphate kinase 6-like [Varroa jacobsoni]
MFSRITLAIIKPDVCACPPKLARIRELINENGFKVLAEQYRRYTIKEMETFYEEHAGKFFFNRLTTYMSSGPVLVWILHQGETTIPNWRALLGPTKVFKAVFEDPDSLRGQFGLTDTRNAAHGSNSPDNVRREVHFFFPDLTEERLRTLLSEASFSSSSK